MQLITRQKLLEQSEQRILLFGTYRVRLMNVSDVPFVNIISTLSNPEVIIVDLDKADNNKMEVSDGTSLLGTTRERLSENDSSDVEYAGSPLKFKFLTLSQLQASDKSRYNSDIMLSVQKRFTSKPLSGTEAEMIINKLSFGDWPFETLSLPDIPVFVMVDSNDVLRTVMLGICKTAKLHTSYRIRYFGTKIDINAWKQIERVGSLFLHCEGVCTAHCTYDIVPETPNTERDSENRISAFLRLAVKWPCAPEELLSKPPPQAPVTVVVYPGWLDSRTPYSDWSSELRLILALGRALRTGQMDWSEADFSVEASNVLDSVKALLKEENVLKVPEEVSYDFLDFTDRLWLAMTGCRNYNMVVDVLGIVFTALRNGYKNTLVHAENKSQMARFLRDACNNEFMLPRLEGLTPIEIMLGMGLERFRRRCIHEILSNELVANVKELDAFYNVNCFLPFEDLADSMFLLYNSLVILTTCKQYLRIGTHQIHLLSRRVFSQFNAMNLSPTKDGITAASLENFELKLKFDVTLIDVYPNVFKIKTPKEWYLNTVYRKNKKLTGESVTYFAREPLLDYIWSSVRARDVNDTLMGSEVRENRTGNEEAGNVELGRKTLNAADQQEVAGYQNIKGFYTTLILSSSHSLPWF